MASKSKALLIALVFIILLVSTVPTYALLNFTDTVGHWAEGEIEKWSGKGLLQGSDGLFRPDELITRAEMAIVIDRVMNYRVQATNNFSDLDNSWYTDAILRANAAGIIRGDQGAVRPMDNITRQEAAIMICRALNIPAVPGTTAFSDDAVIDSWAKEYVKALSAKGLISGVGDNRFAPRENITRAAVVKLLDNAIAEIYTSAGTFTGDSSSNVIVNADGVHLSNMVINGDLIIAEGVGNGSASLNNVTVTGTVFVKGGGRNTVSINSSNIALLTINRTEGDVRVTASGSSRISQTIILTGGTLEELSGLTGQGFENVDLGSAPPDPGVNANLTGRFNHVSPIANGSSIRINGYASDLDIHAASVISGTFSSANISIAPRISATIGGESYTGTDASRLLAVHLLPVDASAGETLTATPICSGDVSSISYQWYYADSNISLENSSGWTRISGASSASITVPSDLGGKYIKVTASDSSSTVQQKLTQALGNGANPTPPVGKAPAMTIGSGSTETSLKLVFDKPLALKVSGSKYEAVQNKYDFKSSSESWFSIKVNSSSVSENDNYVSRAVYSTSDNSITLTLTGNAAEPGNKVTVTLKNSVYDTSGNELKAADALTAVRVADSSSWQDGGKDGTKKLDTSYPTVSVASSGNSATVLRLTFDEVLGYVTDSVVRPLENNSDIKKNSSTSNRLFDIKINGSLSSDDSNVTSAVYTTSGRNLTITLTGVKSSDSVTVATRKPFHDLYGNALSASNFGVFYSKAGQSSWSRASSQSAADKELGNPTPMTLSVNSSASTYKALTLTFSEPLYYMDGSTRKAATNNFDFKSIGSKYRLFNTKLNGANAVTDDSNIESAIYKTSNRTLTISFKNVAQADSFTLAFRQTVYNSSGVALEPNNIGVYYRQSGSNSWQSATSQNAADSAVSALTGTPAIIAGDPPAFDSPLSAGPGTMSSQSGLTYTWYRSDDREYNASGDTKLNTSSSATYTPVKDDIGKYLIVVASASGKTGSGYAATSQTVAKAKLKGGSEISVPYTADIDLSKINGLFILPEYETNGTKTYTLIPDGTGSGSIVSGSQLTISQGGTFNIKLEITETATYAAGTATSVLTVQAGLRSAPPAPESKTIGNDSVELKAVEGCEYSLNGTSWSDSPLFLELDPCMEYTFYQRYAKDSLYDPSASSSKTFKTLGFLVTFNSAGGTSVEAQRVPSINGKATEPTAPTKDDGSDFLGWFSDNSLETAWNFNTVVTDNMTLYAKWSVPPEPEGTP